jgi:hypothetical protein
MDYSLRYFDEVLEDIQQAKKWYLNQKVGLDLEFLKAVEVCIEKVLKRPDSYAIRYRHIRIAHPKRFPFNIHFYIDKPSHAVVIVAIIHGKRHPISVKKRID